jgi:hypothetical protein
MHRYLLLFSLLVLSLVGTACKGEVPDQAYIPASNYLVLNLSTVEAILDPGTTFAAKAFGTPVGLTAPVDLTQYVQWSSTVPSVATVNSDGIIFGNGPGFTQIRATLVGDDGSTLNSGTLVVRVTGDPLASPETIELTGLVIRRDGGATINSTINITTDDALALEVIGKFSDGSSRVVGGITWRVSNPTLAEIGSDGVLTPLKTGIVSVNARLGDVESNYIVVQIAAGAP